MSLRDLRRRILWSLSPAARRRLDRVQLVFWQGVFFVGAVVLFLGAVAVAALIFIGPWLRERKAAPPLPPSATGSPPSAPGPIQPPPLPR